MTSQQSPRLLNPGPNIDNKMTLMKKKISFFIKKLKIKRKFGINNLMFDKRVVRGNTYAAIVTSKNTDN